MLTHLLFMRHAKSSWADADMNDHDRPLNARGRRSADNVAQVLHARGYAPDVIWSSDAQRTRETATRLIRAIPGAQSVQYTSSFYLATPRQVLDACAQYPEPEGKLMLLGHNPGWASLYEIFSGRTDAFPTGTCAVFTRLSKSENWLSLQDWRPRDIIYPRDLDA